MNVFDVETPDRKEHFLALIILAYLLWESTDRDRDGFIATRIIHEEMQGFGFLPLQTDSALRRLTNKRLIETTERLTFEEDLFGLIGDIPEGFRATSIGAYHLRRWAGDFAYLDAMVFDTPIFDEDVEERIWSSLASFDISDRLSRTSGFRNYLSATWEASALQVDYFDWRECVKEGQRSFGAVQAVVRRSRDRPKGFARH